jgi:RimJ/RimL family protein N-acetyltransferase
VTTSVDQVSDRDSTSSPAGGDWLSFVVLVSAHVPAIPPTAGRDFDVTRHGLLDHFQRTLLKRFVEAYYPTIDASALDAARSLGELHDLASMHEYSNPVEAQRPLTNVGLRPLRPGDYQQLYEACLDPTTSFRYRFGGRTPSFDEFRTTLYAGVTAQFAVCDVRDGRLIGLVSAYNEVRDLGHCYLAFQRCGQAAGVSSEREMVDGMCLFVRYLFVTFPLRKLYIEVPEYNEYLIGGMTSSFLRAEGRMAAHYWHAGRYWDNLLLALYREDFEEIARAWFGEE